MVSAGFNYDHCDTRILGEAEKASSKPKSSKGEETIHTELLVPSLRCLHQRQCSRFDAI